MLCTTAVLSVRNQINATHMLFLKKRDFDFAAMNFHHQNHRADHDVFRLYFFTWPARYSSQSRDCWYILKHNLRARTGAWAQWQVTNICSSVLGHGQEIYLCFKLSRPALRHIQSHIQRTDGTVSQLVKLINHLYLLPRLRISGARHQLRRMHSSLPCNDTLQGCLARSYKDLWSTCCVTFTSLNIICVILKIRTLLYLLYFR